VGRRDTAEGPRVLAGLGPELHHVHLAIVADASRSGEEPEGDG
jgi:hypothetical protein